MCDGIVIIKCDVEISICVLMFLKNICSILICKKVFFLCFFVNRYIEYIVCWIIMSVFVLFFCIFKIF